MYRVVFFVRIIELEVLKLNIPQGNIKVFRKGHFLVFLKSCTLGKVEGGACDETV